LVQINTSVVRASRTTPEFAAIKDASLCGRRTNAGGNVDRTTAYPPDDPTSKTIPPTGLLDPAVDVLRPRAPLVQRVPQIHVRGHHFKWDTPQMQDRLRRSRRLKNDNFAFGSVGRNLPFGTPTLKCRDQYACPLFGFAKQNGIISMLEAREALHVRIGTCHTRNRDTHPRAMCGGTDLFVQRVDEEAE